MFEKLLAQKALFPSAVMLICLLAALGIQLVWVLGKPDHGL